MEGPSGVPPPEDLDMRYALGLIDRESYLEERGAVPMAGQRRRPPDRGRRRVNQIAVAVISLTVVILLLFLVILPAIVPSPSISFSSAKRLSQEDLDATAPFEGDTINYSGNNTIWVGGSARMVVLASHHEGAEAFVTQNLTNPTIHMHAGSRLTLLVVNNEPDEHHNLALTTNGPPYNEMPMMHNMNSPGTEMLPPSENRSHWSQEMQISSLPPGEYWYLCQYPGHAEEGMYGALVVDQRH